jgi:hypothetical protein
VGWVTIVKISGTFEQDEGNRENLAITLHLTLIPPHNLLSSSCTRDDRRSHGPSITQLLPAPLLQLIPLSPLKTFLTLLSSFLILKDQSCLTMPKPQNRAEAKRKRL